LKKNSGEKDPRDVEDPTKENYRLRRTGERRTVLERKRELYSLL